MKRVRVVGVTGSGKTTLAAELARRLGVTHVELDALFWEPDWVKTDDATFRARVEEATRGDGWVACGNYWSKLHDLSIDLVDTVVWLDMALPLVLVRVVRRTIRRVVNRTTLWSGNREKISSLWASDGLIRWALTSYRPHRVRYSAAAADPRYVGMAFVRLRSPREVRRWLTTVRAESA